MAEEGRDGSSSHRGVTRVTGGESTSEETERWGDRINTDSTKVRLRTSWVIDSEDRGSVNNGQ
jgi:hypothetical protein